MPSFPHLTLAEAKALAYVELLDRFPGEQQYWHRLIQAGDVSEDDPRYRAFNAIVAAVTTDDFLDAARRCEPIDDTACRAALDALDTDRTRP